MQKTVKYGGAEGELGMIIGGGQSPVGPEAFALGRDGTVLVADAVNHRVAVYSGTGDYLRSLSLPGIALGDVAADAQGRLYVYDQVRRALYQYDDAGQSLSTLQLDPADIDTRGYFHVVANSVYFADAAARDVLVANLQEGTLTAPESSAARKADGIHADSGRIYSIGMDTGQALRVQVNDPAAPNVALNLSVPLPGVVAARYAGEDQAQRFYVQTESQAGTRIVVDVLAFSPAGELLATTRLPQNDYVIWTTKLVDVGASGTIVQFLPQREQARLNLFLN